MRSHHFNVKRDGTVLERDQLRGKVEHLAAGWQAIDASGTCDEIAYGTRTTAAMSLLKGCSTGPRLALQLPVTGPVAQTPTVSGSGAQAIVGVFGAARPWRNHMIVRRAKSNQGDTEP